MGDSERPFPEFEALIGNESQKRFFVDEIRAGRLPHALILEGEEGSGRHTLALAAAAALADDPAESGKILRGICPDVKIFGVQADKKTFTVDVIRALRQDAAIKPGELAFKVYIIENTEKMNVQAQNAALKLLEEPPGATYFFLLCENARTLLPTVRSRAPVIRMQRFTPEQLDAIFRNDPACASLRDTDRAFYDAALANSSGSFGKAKSALLNKESPAGREKADRILDCLAPPQKAALLIEAGKLPSKRQELDEILALLECAFRDMLAVRCGARISTLFYFPTPERAESASEALTERAILKLCDAARTAREGVSRNVNTQNARMALAKSLYAASAE